MESKQYIRKKPSFFPNLQQLLKFSNIPKVLLRPLVFQRISKPGCFERTTFIRKESKN